jgi:integrase
MWWIKLRVPGERRVERSLGTPDRRHAEVVALPMIAEHKAELLARGAIRGHGPYIFHNWVPEFEPGREHVADDGHRIVATQRELIHVQADGTTRTEPNGGMGWEMFTRGTPTMADGRLLADIALGKAPMPKLPKMGKDRGDDAILDTYLQHKGITGYSEREARAVWAQFKSITNDKPLKQATRDDGRKLVARFEAQGIKSRTIQKKIMWLSAACNLAVKEDRLKANPFSGITPKRDDGERRLPLSDADMKAIKAGLGKLAKQDQLLVLLLASTGLRLGEAFQIASEEKERGVRYVVVGTKTEASLRRVPLPAVVLDHLPKVITGPLFKGGARPASKRLNRFLRDVGITDPAKVAHSFRHRAKDRLRAAGCPLDVQYELLGHEDRTVAAGYGRGSPVPLLKRWIDKLGC